MMAQQAPAGAAPRDLGRFRVLSCGQLIKQPWGQLLVEYVVLSAEATVLHVTMRLPASGLGGRFGRISSAALGRGPRPDGLARHLMGTGAPGQLILTDDQGTPCCPTAPDDPDGDLTGLIGLGGLLPDRLAATVIAAWTERLRESAALAAAARPALHAALYGPVTVALRSWTGQRDLQVAGLRCSSPWSSRAALC
jgi:hypothetical protein